MRSGYVVRALPIVKYVCYFFDTIGANVGASFLPKWISIDFVEQSEQRYDTLGDYGEAGDGVWFKITRFERNPMRSIFVLIHEIWEFFRNRKLGIPVKVVDEFDLSNPELEDPGLDLRSPYHRTHMEADVLERTCVVMDGDDWVEYEKEAKEVQ